MDERTGALAAVTARAARQGLVTEPLEQTVDRDSYTPALLSLLSNMLVWGGSRIFRHLHGLGTNEWRVLSALANRPGSTASDVSDVLGMNKAICSKSVNTLLDRELIAQLNGARGFRHLYLTPRGASVHDDCLAVALKRQEILLDPLSPAEVAQLNALLVRMLGSSASLERFEREVISEEQRS